jgi:TPR repeat protein
MLRGTPLALALAAALAAVAPGARARADTPSPAPAPLADPALVARCQGGELRACTQALRALIASREAPKVRARLPELVRGCDRGAGTACASAAQALAFPDPSVQDPERSARLARRACDLGAPVGCVMLGVDHLYGRGVKADPAEAAKLLQRACEKSADGCWILGILRARGQGVARDAGEARSLFRRACSQKLLIACVDLRRLDALEAGQEALGPKGAIGDDLDPLSVYPLPFQGELDYCDRGDLDACAQVAWHFLSAAAPGQPRASRQPTLEAEARVAVLLLEATCQHGSAYDCLDMAQRLEEGKAPVVKDPTRAAELYRKACEGGATKACAHAGAR